MGEEFSNLDAMHRYAVIFVMSFAIACGNGSITNSNGPGDRASEPSYQAGPHSDHKAMEHGRSGHTMESSAGAESAPVDLQFLDSMIAHHKGAVEMAMLAETRGGRDEVKELAANIINDQEREMAKMSEWRDQWFGEKPEAINMRFPGMAHGMNGMDMKSLESKTGNDFDIELIRQMIPHHEGAIEMAKAIRAGNSRAELKELAEDIMSAQEAEVHQMREWLAKWQPQ